MLNELRWGGLLGFVVCMHNAPSMAGCPSGTYGLYRTVRYHHDRCGDPTCTDTWNKPDHYDKASSGAREKCVNKQCVQEVNNDLTDVWIAGTDGISCSQRLVEVVVFAYCCDSGCICDEGPPIVTCKQDTSGWCYRDGYIRLPNEYQNCP